VTDTELWMIPFGRSNVTNGPGTRTVLWLKDFEMEASEEVLQRLINDGNSVHYSKVSFPILNFDTAEPCPVSESSDLSDPPRPTAGLIFRLRDLQSQHDGSAACRSRRGVNNRATGGNLSCLKY